MCRTPGLNNILTAACARALLSPRPADTNPAAGSKSHDACRAMSPATVTYGPVDEPDGRVTRSNSVNGSVVDNAIYVDGVRTANPATLDETYELLGERQGMAWIGLYRPTPEEIRSVGAEFGLHHLVVDDAIAAHQRPKLASARRSPGRRRSGRRSRPCRSRSTPRRLTSFCVVRRQPGVPFLGRVQGCDLPGQVVIPGPGCELWMLIVTPTRRGYMPPGGQADPSYLRQCIKCAGP